MPYTAEISRTHPSCLLFLIDQSGSMSDNFVSIQRSKAGAVADAINKMIQQLVIKCAKSEGIRDYYYVGVIGYGIYGAKSAFSGPLAGHDLLAISDIAKNPARIEERTKKIPDGAGGLVDTKVKFPMWFDPISEGGTPMKEAFSKANEVIKSWLSAHPDCFPPIVINITDGESTDGDPLEEMRALKSLTSSDGHVLLFNIHASARASNSVSFCGASTVLPDQYAELLFEGASVMPDFMKKFAEEEYQLSMVEDARAFVMNGDIDVVITAIEIGSRASNLLR